MVLVKEEDGWIPFFSPDPEVTAVEILEAMADRNAQEQVFKDVKEIWGAGQQQVRNIYSNEGVLQPEPVDVQPGGDVGVGQGRGRVGGP